MLSPLAAIRQLVQHVQVTPADDGVGLPFLIQNIALACNHHVFIPSVTDNLTCTGHWWPHLTILHTLPNSAMWKCAHAEVLSDARCKTQLAQAEVHSLL